MGSLEATPEVTMGKYTVQSVSRALDILDMIANVRSGLTLTEITKGSGLSKSASYSLIRTLVDRGYLQEVSDGPRYKLGMSLVRMGEIALDQMPLADLARQVLVHLSEELAMTSRVAVADEGQPVFIDRVDGPGTVRFHTPLGKKEHPYATSAGKAILSCLPDEQVTAICARTGMIAKTSHTITSPEKLLEDLALARSRGFAIEDEEDALGVVCVGAPFFNHNGNVAGAISVTFMKLDLQTEQFLEIGQVVRDHANQLSASLGFAA
jgi:IclR family acetate operon transcriptional repressor